MSKILNKITNWARKEDSIKVVMLTGSLAGKGPKDDLSDYDIAIFTDDIEKYANDDTWIHEIENVWVVEPCVMYKNNKDYPTRLVIYRDGLQVDYAFFDLDHLNDLKNAKTLPVEYNLGYKILLDKGDFTKGLQEPTYEYPFTKKPSQEEFDLLVKVFFFEAFKEAKALVRKDLWHAKIRDWSIKKRLLKMIEWHEKCKHGFDYDTNCDAKRMKSWVDPEIWRALHDVFSNFDAADSWKKFIKTVELFSKLAQEVADSLGLKYTRDVDENISGYIKKLRGHHVKNN